MAEKALSSLRVLVVDDNPDIAESLGILARLWGHQVRLAYDGQAALHEALAFHPDVIILDIGLPKKDGYEVAQTVKQTPGLQQALLIAATGYGGEQDRRRSREVGFDYHLVKPVDPDYLHEVLASRASQERFRNAHVPITSDYPDTVRGCLWE